jgi:hypothetical protein
MQGKSLESEKKLAIAEKPVESGQNTQKSKDNISLT